MWSLQSFKGFYFLPFLYTEECRKLELYSLSLRRTKGHMYKYLF